MKERPWMTNKQIEEIREDEKKRRRNNRRRGFVGLAMMGLAAGVFAVGRQLMSDSNRRRR